MQAKSVWLVEVAKERKNRGGKNYRKMAQEMRARAESFTDESARNVLMRLSDTYEHLAQNVADWERDLPRNGKPETGKA